MVKAAVEDQLDWQNL